MACGPAVPTLPVLASRAKGGQGHRSGWILLVEDLRALDLMGGSDRGPGKLGAHPVPPALPGAERGYSCILEAATHCVTSGKAFSGYVPQSPHLSNVVVERVDHGCLSPRPL